MLLFTVLIGLVCLVSGLTQLVINHCADSGNLPILRAARRLTGIGLIIGGGYVLYSAAEYGYANGAMCLALGILSLGQLLFAMHSRLEPGHTMRLMARKYEPRSRDEATHA